MLIDLFRIICDLIGLHIHDYPDKWTDMGPASSELYGSGVAQKKRCATCGKLKMVARFPSVCR